MQPRQFTLRELFLVTGWIAVCSALYAFGNLNVIGGSIVVAGVLISFFSLVSARASNTVIWLAFAAALLYAYDRLSPVSVGDGRGDFEIEASVLDSESSKAIPAARLEVRDLDPERRSNEPNVLQSCETNAAGRAKMTREFWVSGYDTPLTSQKRVRAPKWEYLVVRRDGYQAIEIPLTQEIGAGIPTDRRIKIVLHLRRVHMEEIRGRDDTKR